MNTMLNLHRQLPQAVKLMLLVAFCTLSGTALFISLLNCYDPLDSSGNITVTIDINQRTDDGYLARVTLQNYYQYRHVTEPGWKLGWTWTNKEVIWSMKGAFAIDRGNCSTYKNPIPHSCMQDPTIVDFSSDVSEESRTENCCRGGLLSARAINPMNSLASFELKVGTLANDSLGHAPTSLTLMAPGPGYTCSPLLDTDPTTIPDFGGQRQVPAYRTWKSACTYSSFLAHESPVCCSSLSTFYNPTITSCPSCSCGCPNAEKGTETCIRPVDFSSPSNYDNDQEIMQCTDHMCPIRVHWHIKNNYRDYWRVKLTISNYIRNRNYSNWNLLVQHPGLSQPATTYSFNSTVLPTVGFQAPDTFLPHIVRNGKPFSRFFTL
ncbi:hypothetical protein K1719_005128 [Acacia pycnantha]|nr:hypothetical protein K1719_005128 [Acacia pycnantha]